MRERRANLLTSLTLTPKTDSTPYTGEQSPVPGVTTDFGHGDRGEGAKDADLTSEREEKSTGEKRAAQTSRLHQTSLYTNKSLI